MLKLKNLNISPNFFIFLIVSLNFLAPLAIDEYTPSLPYILQSLNSTPAFMQLTVTFYMVGMMVGQFFVGFLSDHYGRRPLVLWSIPINILGSLICIFAPNVALLLIGRLLQGLGIGGVGNTAGAIISDSFEGDDLNRVGGILGTAYGFVPIMAPILGGLIQDFFGWRANFGFLFLIGVICFFLYLFYLPESHSAKERHQLSISNLLKNFKHVLSNWYYLLSVSCMAFSWSTCIVFSLMGPFLMEVKLGFSATQYGFLALLIGVGFLLGSTLFTFGIKYISIPMFKLLAICNMVIMSLVLLIFGLCGVINVWSIMLPIFCLMIGAGICFPIFFTAGMSAIPEYAGIANSLIGMQCLLWASVVSLVITQLHAHSLQAMASVYLGLSIITALLALARNWIKY